MRIASLSRDLREIGLPGVAAAILLAVAGIAIAALPLSLAGAAILGAITFALILIRLEYGIYLAILAVPFGSLREVSVGPASVSVTDLVVPLVFVSWLLKLVAQRDAVVRFTPIFPFAVLFFGVLVLSATISLSLPLSAKELLKWGEFLLLFLVVANVMKTSRQIALVVAFLLLATSIEALHGWYQFLLRQGPEGFLIGGRFLRAFGTFGQPNPYAGYLGLTLPILLGLLIGAKWDLSLRVDLGFAALAAASLIIIAAMLMSLSRGAWLGLAAAMAFMLAIRSRRSLVLLLTGIVVATIIGLLGALDVLPALVMDRLAIVTEYFGIFDVRQVTLTSENWAIVERMAYWQSAWDMFRDHSILGVGIGNFSAFYPDYAFPDWEEGALGHAHNYYLNLLAESGILGFIAYVSFLMVIFLFALRTLKRLQAVSTASPKGWSWFSQPYPLALGITGALLELSVHNFFDVLYVHSMAVQIGLILGLLVAIRPPLLTEGD